MECVLLNSQCFVEILERERRVGRERQRMWSEEEEGLYRSHG